MASKRENTFPPTSIGRGQTPQIQRAHSPARETLSAHPLLSPTSSTTNVTATSTPESSPASGTAGQAAPKYVPYTPRQRVPATTGTTNVAAHQQQQHGAPAAAGKLQMMNLKAAVQNVGLDHGSVGWAILERLVGGEGENTPEWNEVWSALALSKATLLLPLEQASSHEKITAEFVKDHLVLCEGLSRNNAPIVTLSGLRGVLTEDILTIRSCISPTSKTFQNLLSPATRASTLSSLPPLPALPDPNTYPTFIVPTYAPALPLPRLPTPSKPPLPPRPGAAPTPPRISNPFASLFGKATSPPTAPATPAAPPPDGEHPADVPAFTLARRIERTDTAKALTKALRGELKAALGVAGTPAWVVERAQNFCTALYPLTKAREGEGAGARYRVSAAVRADEVAERVQELYALIEQDLRAASSPTTARRREEGNGAGAGAGAEEAAAESEESVRSAARIREVLEAVERTICTLFYDRLFSQPTSDDASHDEALASRIAALNMLDLSLDHLDVDVGVAGHAVDEVVRDCGATLSQLDLSRSPAEKAAVMVAATKVVVDGLSKLPPIRLKSEEEAAEARRARALRREANGAIVPPVPPKPDVDLATELVTSPTSVPSLHVPDEGDIGDDTLTAHDASALTKDQLPPRDSSLRSRSKSPSLLVSPPDATPVSGDVLLPLLIFSVVKANPPHLVSHLLYTQRFRNQSFGGEEGYCLINLMAVAEFLENVDLGALGLGESEKKVISTADLTPIPINRGALESPTALTSQDGLPGSLRNRMEQQVDAIAGSANKVVSGVIDSSFGVLRSLLPGTPDLTTPEGGVHDSAPWNSVRPGFGLLRRESGFSIANLAASLPGSREKVKTVAALEHEGGQQLVEVSSRPASVKSMYAASEDASSSSQSEDDEEDEEDEDERQTGLHEGAEEMESEVHDTRSIRSFESMMSNKKHDRKEAIARKSLSDRLAHMSGFSRAAHGQGSHKDSPPPSRRTSLLVAPAPPNRFDTPSSSRAASPSLARLAPPNQRFLECTADDLRVSEIAELLRDYKRLAEGARALGAFDD